MCGVHRNTHREQEVDEEVVRVNKGVVSWYVGKFGGSLTWYRSSIANRPYRYIDGCGMVEAWKFRP